MKFDDYANFVRKLTETTANSFDDGELTLFSNISKDDLAEEIVQLDEDWFDLTLTTNLVASQREYSFPLDMLKNMKMVEAKLDGTNWKRLKEFDLNSYRIRQQSRVKPFNSLDIESSFSNATTDEATIIAIFSDDTPSFDIDGEALFIYSGTAISAVTSGLRLKATIYPADFVNADWALTTEMSIRENSTSTAMPRASHEVLARRTAILFKESNNIALNSFDLNFEISLQKMKRKLSKPNLDRVITPRVPRDTGFNY